ncbi:hypothetical protein FIBSPDRAFT_851064 [Athelia psychrophila]|uniref:Uncharacterized protein n=1 Tax=Athelia psychrophila TaxID=1759441 RepID=A0A166SVG9_9AGAM|nr:hypothetical protein FIBSPDRAFT_851064 [Fibularhizoctonia sp. CBS 109695]
MDNSLSPQPDNPDSQRPAPQTWNSKGNRGIVNNAGSDVGVEQGGQMVHLDPRSQTQQQQINPSSHPSPQPHTPESQRSGPQIWNCDDNSGIVNNAGRHVRVELGGQKVYGN